MNPGGREAGPVDYDDVWTNVYGDIQESGPVHRHLTRIVGRLAHGMYIVNG